MVTVTPGPRKWQLVALGIAIRLVGVLLLWLGDGSEDWWRKTVVIVGVLLSIGGLTLLRFLLLSGPLSRLSAATVVAVGAPLSEQTRPDQPGSNGRTGRSSDAFSGDHRGPCALS